MKFPWQERADEAQRRRVEAQKRLADVEAGWPRVLEHAGVLKRERELNGWTSIVATLFADQREGR